MSLHGIKSLYEYLMYEIIILLVIGWRWSRLADQQRKLHWQFMRATAGCLHFYLL